MINFSGDITQWLPVWAGLLFVMVIGRVTKQEQRLTLLAIAGAVAAPSADTLFFVGVIGLTFKALDLIQLH